ncbi:hypothetical protein Csp1_26010 [Corynebacterium provencense]|jgi:hypothetical protein|uniref:Uncharacterized protein n=1 Tax=Corynebacterium provencense TaxID=1737425 RepID=A0A2Z3YPD5_9CORY|nr:hypothetical protein [Corynebacterium provencense]AWT27345.1 hypothetical protein Csp1_26010 [Corynebacterium provencense]MCI1256927.1 hypothetical protein [Corynebacterium provencense]
MSAQQLPQRRGAAVRGFGAHGGTDGLASVLELPGLVHDAVNAVPAPPPEAADHELTLLLLAEHHVTGLGWFTRALGLNGALSVADTVRSVLISLDWPGAATMLTPEKERNGDSRISTWSLQARRDDRLRVYSRTAGSIGTPLREALGRDGTGVLVVDGYTVTVTTAGAMPRDGHTPDAVCLAGGFAPDDSGTPSSDLTVVDPPTAFPPGTLSGSLPETPATPVPVPGEFEHPVGLPRDVDLAAVNVALTGEETVAEILGGLAPELRELLLGGDLYEFTPLLQALDLGRPAQVADTTRGVLESFPAEKSQVGRAAAWSRVVALSTLSDRETSDEVTAMLMAALGFTRADAGLAPVEGRLSSDPLDAAEIRALSAASGRLLAICGADVWDGPASEVTPLVPKCSLVDRLEMYRFLLQA